MYGFLTGSQDHEKILNSNGEEERKNYNSAVLLDLEGNIADIYHKIHLVPFSEYFPYKEEFLFIEGLLERFYTFNWSVGERRFSFEHPDFGFNTPICFEDVFSGELRGIVHNGTDIFVNIPDYFWSMPPVEAKQHGIHSMFRTIENRRAVVRSTCSGYTVYFDRLGRVVKETDGYYVESFVNAEVPVYSKSWIIYNKFGDWFPILSVAVIFIIIGFSLLSRGKEKLS